MAVAPGGVDSGYAWVRLAASVCLSTLGGVGHVVDRRGAAGGAGRLRRRRAADASLPYTLTMIGFGVGGILMGRLADRFGVMVPVSSARWRWAPAIVAAGLRRQPAGSSRWRRAC